MGSFDPTVYTQDRAKVTSVVWVLNYDDVAPEYADGDVEVPGDLLERRFSTAADLLAMKVRKAYPRVRDIAIRDGGWGGDMAAISPRADTDDYSIYEPFFDEVSQWSDEACSIAIETHPMPID